MGNDIPQNQTGIVWTWMMELCLRGTVNFKIAEFNEEIANNILKPMLTKILKTFSMNFNKNFKALLMAQKQTGLLAIWQTTYTHPIFGGEFW